MKLTNNDQKQIERDVDDMVRKIEVCASEYAHLYEISFYKALAERIQTRIEAKEYVREYVK